MFFQSQRDERHELTDHFLALANPTRLRMLERSPAWPYAMRMVH